MLLGYYGFSTGALAPCRLSPADEESLIRMPLSLRLVRPRFFSPPHMSN